MNVSPSVVTADCSLQVVIAGRTVFKIYSIEEESFVEVVNLRSGKNINLNYSCNDVVWSNLVGYLDFLRRT